MEHASAVSASPSPARGTIFEWFITLLQGREDHSALASETERAGLSEYQCFCTFNVPNWLFVGNCTLRGGAGFISGFAHHPHTLISNRVNIVLFPRLYESIYE